MSRHRLVALVVLSGLLATVWTSAHIRRRGQQRQRRAAGELASERSHAVQLRLVALAGALKQLAASMEPQAMSRARFQRFAAELATQHPGVVSFQWVPRVTADVRPALAQRARAEGREGFRIRPLASDDDLRAAGVVYPIYYLAPLHSARGNLGRDVGSDPKRLSAMTYARDTASVAASDPIALDLRASPPQGFQVFAPVYRSLAPGTLELRRAALSGFVAALIDPERLIQASEDDVSTGAARVSVELVQGVEAWTPETPRAWGASLDFAGRAWQLRCSLPEALVPGPALGPWTVGWLGLALTLILAARVYLLGERQHRARRKLGQRSAALARLQHDLATERAAVTQLSGELDRIHEVWKRLERELPFDRVPANDGPARDARSGD